MKNNSNVRKMKVYDQCGYQYKRLPVITMKGEWLKQFGFSQGTEIEVHCEDGKLIITKVDAGNNIVTA